MPKSYPLSRRTVLKGAGVALGLPLLEAMAPLSALAAAGSQAEKSPVRMAALFMPNGVHPKLWTPTGSGANFQLSPVLAPLESLKNDILVLTNLWNRHSDNGDGHYAKTAPFLTGTTITKTTGSDLRSGGVSMDQVAAQRVGNQTPLPSLELSIEPVTTGVDTNVGFTRLYGSHISWSSPTTPVAREINPQLAFDRLFRSKAGAAGSGGASREDKSVLDAVLGEAKRLRATVGSTDRRKLDEYFESVRSVERRIAFDAARRQQEVLADPRVRQEIEKLGNRITSYYNVPEKEHGIDHTEQVRLMLDIIWLSFWTDSTRVASFMFGNDVSGKNFSFLPGVDGGHHQISHHENDAAKLEQYEKINLWHVEQYAYLLNRLKSIPEKDGTLLDHSMILFGSSLRDGNSHDPHNLPVVLGGRAGGTLATGRHLPYENNTPLCNLYHGMLNRAGASVEHFGDSTGELPGLSDAKYPGATAPTA